MISNMSLQDFELMGEHPKFKSIFIEWQCQFRGIEQNYSDFSDRIEDEIESIVLDLEANRPYYKDLTEDQISSHIVSMLKQKGIKASHGTFFSGSTDILVEHGNCQWIGEAKWHRSDENVIEGMRQLSTRYSSGSDKCSRGGLIIYNDTKNINEKVLRLKKHWGDNGHHEYINMIVQHCPKSSNAFITKHQHESSGLDYLVRHRWVTLHHEPKDKSGRNKKAK